MKIMDSYYCNSNNRVGASGGAINTIMSEIVTNNTTFHNNRASELGGTVYNDWGNLSMTKFNTYFTSSTAIHNRGAIHIANGNLRISNGHFINNNAGNLGGAAVFCFAGEN